MLTKGTTEHQQHPPDPNISHYSDVMKGAMASQTPASWLFTEPFIQAQVKENIRAPRHWPLWGEFTGDRWIPRTNGQKRGKCLHLMTSWGAYGSHVNSILCVLYSITRHFFSQRQPVYICLAFGPLVFSQYSNCLHMGSDFVETLRW